jgi:hypothetical protein
MNQLLKSVPKLLRIILKLMRHTFKPDSPTCTPRLMELRNLPTRYNVIVGFEHPSEWVGCLVNLLQLLNGKKFPHLIHSFVLIRLDSSRWLYAALTWDGIQIETIERNSGLLTDDVSVLIPLACNLQDINDNLDVLVQTEALLGKSFRYSPLGFLDYKAWLNCSSFVSAVLGHETLSYCPSDLLETLLGETNE